MAVLKEIAALSGHEEQVWHVSWSPDGSRLASCSGDRTIRIFTEKGTGWVCTAVLEEAQNRTIRACEWSPCGKFIAATSFDATTVIWENSGSEFRLIATLEGHENEVKSVNWKPDGTLLATSSRDKSIWIWDGTPENDFECISVLHGHTQDVKFVLWHPDDEYLFTASYDDTIRVWKDDGGHTSTVWSLAFDRIGSYLASCSDDRKIIVWKEFPSLSPRWKQVCCIQEAHQRTIYSIDWGNENGLIVSGGGDDAIKVFRKSPESSADEPSFSNIISITKAHDGEVNCVRWHPKRRNLLASAGDDNLVKIWKLEGEEDL